MSVFIVAEAGVNHLGDRAKMLALCDAAKTARADAVKFQAYDAAALCVRRGLLYDAGKGAGYFSTGKDDATVDLLKRSELTDADLDAIAAHCRAIGLKWFASVFDPSQVERVLSRGACALKIGHAEADWSELRRECRANRPSWDVPVWISNPNECDHGYNEHPVLCVEQYPATSAPELSRIGPGKQQFKGFSSHYTDYRIPAAAALLGAAYIECHLMLGEVFDLERATMVNPAPGVWHYSDKKCNTRAEEPEPEAAWSLYPYEFREMCALIRFHESLL